MLSNHDYFLSNTREECCKNFYEWNLYSCTGTKPTLTNGDYYPDWSGGSSTQCLNDGEVPDYMLSVKLGIYLRRSKNVARGIFSGISTRAWALHLTR